MADMGVYLAFDVDYISMIPTGGELVACRHSVKVDDEDLAGAYELIRKLYQEVRIERDNLKQENAKLRELVRDMWRFTGTACKKYPKLFDPSARGGQMVQLNQIDSFEQRMRELGVLDE